MSVRGKVILVTGGASGIGRASTVLFARQGAKVVVADREAEAGRSVAQALRDHGGEAAAIAADVASSASVDHLVQEMLTRFGRIDVLLHCAGICPRRSVLDMTDTEWSDVIRVNLDGTFYVTRSVARPMIAQRSGTMILLTSDRGINGAADYPHYAASKGGMIALMKSLAIALGPYGVTVNGLNPGMTDTPLARGAITDEAWQAKMSVDVLKSYTKPEQVAEIALFLAGAAADFMTGQVIATRMRNFA